MISNKPKLILDVKLSHVARLATASLFFLLVIVFMPSFLLTSLQSGGT